MLNSFPFVIAKKYMLKHTLKQDFFFAIILETSSPTTIQTKKYKKS